LLLESQFLGGNPSYADIVENYPGFPDGVKGFELGQRMGKQLENIGAEIMMAEVKKIDFETMTIHTEAEELKTKTIILSMGLKHKELGIPTEKDFKGKGVVYCTVCDGPLYKDKDTVVAGSGIPAITSSLYLDEIAKSVVLVTPSSELKAKEDVFLERIKDSNVKVITNSRVKELKGKDRLEGVVIENKDTGETHIIETQGIFVNIGKVPNTKFLVDSGIEMTKKGYIKVNDKQETSIENVYAVGDVTNAPYKQISTAVGDGCKAALNISKLLGKR
jgi:thioredoxin reductase (NADPH)